jgi:dTDP-4-dehydrorhamnose reductase
LDLSQPETIKIIKEIKPDLVINTVAYNDVDKCEAEADSFALAKTINTRAVGVLADLCLELKAILVHYSSDYVFSGQGTEPGFSEDSVPAPINKYGQTKLGGERELQKRGEAGLRYYLIRTSKLFGPKGRSSLSKPSFFDIILKLAQNKKEIEVVNEELSCFTYTPDLAAMTFEIIEEKYPFGIYHIINPGPVTWYGAAIKLLALAGVDTKILPVRAEHLSRPAKRPRYSVLINTKLKSLRPWTAALKEYMQDKKI